VPASWRYVAGGGGEICMGAAGSGPEHELASVALSSAGIYRDLYFLKDPDTEMVALDDGTAI